MGTPLEQFEIILLVPLNFVGLLDFSITNSLIYLVIILKLCIILNMLVLYNMNLFSFTFLNNFLESSYLFIFGMIRQQSGLYGQNFFLYFFFIFWLILVANLIRLSPYGFTITGHIIVTFFLAFSFNLSFFLYGIFKNGLKFFLLFLPKGSPVFLMPLLIVIEILSYCLRTLSLSIRLFANMMAGHTLMFILSSFIVSFLNLKIMGLIPSIFTFFLLMFVFILEVGIAFLQAYVFVILLSIYLRDAVEPIH